MRTEEIQRHLNSKAPLFFVITTEERKFEEILKDLAKKNKMKYHSWSFAAKTNDAIATPFILGGAPIPGHDLLQEIDWVVKADEDTVILWKGLGRTIKNHDGEPNILRRIREFIINPDYYVNQSKGVKYKPIFILDSNIDIPYELEKESIVIDFDLSTKEEILDMLSEWEKTDQSSEEKPKAEKKLFQDKNAIAENLRGLSDFEIENLLAYLDVYYAENPKIDVLDIVRKQKRQLIKKSQFLDIISHDVSIEDVGGMDILKSWLIERREACSKEAEEYGLAKPRGVLLVGLPGGGKSLVAKSVASLWKVPLVKWDVSKLFNSFIGASERNTRTALKTIEAIGNCVLWIDEIEKGLAGVHSSTYTDAGTTARIFGVILTWLQENNSGAFLVATSNNIKQLPPELMRKGRFNDIFFVPLPSPAERKEIFEIHLKKKNRKPKNFDLNKLAEVSENMVGAEIEEAINAAMHTSYADKKRELKTEDIVSAIKLTIPLSKTMGDELKMLNNYATEGRVRFASSTGDNAVLTKKLGFNQK